MSWSPDGTCARDQLRIHVGFSNGVREVNHGAGIPVLILHHLHGKALKLLKSIKGNRRARSIDTGEIDVHPSHQARNQHLRGLGLLTSFAGREASSFCANCLEAHVADSVGRVSVRQGLVGQDLQYISENLPLTGINFQNAVGQAVPQRYPSSPSGGPVATLPHHQFSVKEPLHDRITLTSGKHREELPHDLPVC